MLQDTIDSSMKTLLDAVRLTFEAETDKDTAAAGTLNRALTLLPEIKLDPDRPQARELPVCRHLSRALDHGEGGAAAPVAAAIRALEPTINWAQSASHSIDLRGAEFMDNYAYSSLGLTGSAILDVGLLLFGPGIDYPVTSYPSEGVFLVIGGSPQWKSGDDPWRQVSAGDIIHRPLGGAEGKRPGNEPMLAFYAWISE